ncbi:MAG: DNA-directed DNA polymerase, partial [Nanoarchaeota archaeon]|nr:DNA-directed DNA polymerase [Nanoarchaeota archaeon]
MEKEKKQTTEQFYLLDIDYNSQGTVIVYGRTKAGKRIVVYDDSMKPHFWVLSGSKQDQKKIELMDGVISTEMQKKSYLDKPVDAIKVTVEKPADIQEIKEKVKKMSLEKKEIDIPFHKRYLIEKNILPLQLCEVKIEEQHEGKIKGEVKPFSNDSLDNPKVLAFDIETYGLMSGIDKIRRDPIISLAFYGEKIRKIISWKKPKKSVQYLTLVEDEAHLIEEFIKTIKHYDPDYIIGYFSDGFDFPYLKGRAEKYKIPMNICIDNSQVRIRKSGFTGSAKIKGLPHIDVFRFVSGIMGNSLNFDSYSLNAVAKEFLLQGKKEFDLSKIESMWDKGEKLESLFEYNLFDAELTYRLCQKILPNLHELVKLIGMPVYDVCRMTYGQLVENYLLRKAKEFNEICPNRPKYDIIQQRRTQTYEGAFVMEPKPGLYENIAFFDFLSLYPTIIISKNISPGTLNNSKGNKTPEIKKGRYYYFDNSKQAFIPKVLKDILVQRSKIKEKLKDDNQNHALKARSYALKTIGNSTYGYLGFFGARWYSKECAESITAWARYYIQDVIKKAEKYFGNVIYGDTDSCSIELGKHKRTEAKQFLMKINKSLPGIMELELEDFYKRGIFVSKKGESKGAKKKYALIDDEGKIKIVGFETVRRDWSLIARSTQKKVLEMILREGKMDNALNYAREIIKKVLSNKIDIKLMIISTKLKMGLSEYRAIGPHVAVARKMKEKGMTTSPGSQIDYVITSRPGMIRDKAELPSEAKNYDPEYYINHQIIPSIEKIFEVFGIKKDQIISSAKGQ